jgi:hypothetical protein
MGVNKKRSTSKVVKQLSDLAGEMLVEIKSVIRDLALKPTETADDHAIQTWMIYLLVLAHDAAKGAVSLSMGGNTRAATILHRQLYEYLVRLKYVMIEPEVHCAQFRGRPARHFRRVSALDLPEALRAKVARIQAAWKAQNPVNDPLDVDRSLKEMALAASTETDYVYYYGIPSLFTHGDIVAMFDVIDESDAGKFRVSMQSISLLPEMALATVVMLLGRLWAHLCSAGLISDDEKFADRMMSAARVLAADLGIDEQTWLAKFKNNTN